MPEDRAHAFLQMIRRSQRGRLKIYLGYGPGVGKTYQMLSEARRLKTEGIDVVLGLVETHNRPDTVAMVEGLESVPLRRIEYRGIVVHEMDTDAILRRNAQVVLIDELAHTNAPGSRNAKRYQDVQDVLAAGIHVISALNIQHLESLYNTVEQLVGVRVRERIPDAVLAGADQVINIDLAAEDLQKRLRDGKIYPADRIQSSLQNFFTESNLEHLRELTLRELASQLDFKRRENAHDQATAPPHPSAAPDQIMVCLSSRGPNTARLLRYASRLAGRLNRNWYAVYVQTPREEPTVIDARAQREVSDQLTLATQLGATVFTFKGQEVADTILRFASEYRVGQVVIGRPRPVPWWKRLIGENSVAEELIHRAKGVTIMVVDADGQEGIAGNGAALFDVAGAPREVTNGTPTRGTLGQMLTADRIAIWNEPVTKEQIRDRLVTAITSSVPLLNNARVIQALSERESRGSTFLNDGVALPHARLDELSKPEFALGLTHAGVLDAPAGKPIEAVFLLLSPTTAANVHLQILSQVSRALQDRHLRQALRSSATPGHALDAIISFDAIRSGQKS